MPDSTPSSSRAILSAVHDPLVKGLLRGAVGAFMTFETQREVKTRTQYIDVLATPDSAALHRLRRMGLLGRVLADGPTLIEVYSRTPNLRRFQACMNKQQAYHQELSRAARRARGKHPAPPILWCLSPGEPRSVLREYGMEPMRDWPEGCYRAPFHSGVHVMKLAALPENRETLFLRLMGAPQTVRKAVRELDELPVSAWEYRAASAPLLDVYAALEQNPHTESIMRGLSQEIESVYERVLREGREAGERAVLVKQLRARFGRLPRGVKARVKGGSQASLDRWLERILTAESVEQVFADE